MKVLVLGSGGREHALAWRLQRDPDVSAVIVAPGNPGIAALGPCLPVDVTDPASMLALARQEQVNLTVVGPEAILERGVANLFGEAGLPVLGPSRRAAALECSKVYAKEFMARHRVPTAEFAVCDTAEAAMSVLASRFPAPVVLKADGLAAGKGVIVAETRQEAEAAVRAAMIERQFGAAGARLVVEERLTGPEVSFFVLSDGVRVVPLGTAQDHKRIFDGDRGPNTGGMGAFAPSPLVDAALSDEVMRRIVTPVIEGMRLEGHAFVGFLYVGLMLTSAGPRVIEFNVRFGDPEAQVVLPLIEGGFAAALLSAAQGRLQAGALSQSDRCYVGVALASRGYPASSESGRPITGLDRAAGIRDALVFHAGTRLDREGLVTAGGRVLTVVGGGSTYEQAMQTAYTAVDTIHFDGMQFRRDIGAKAIALQQR